MIIVSFLRECLMSVGGHEATMNLEMKIEWNLIVGCLHIAWISGNPVHSESFIPAPRKTTRSICGKHWGFITTTHRNVQIIFKGWRSSRVNTAMKMKMSSFILATPRHLTWHLGFLCLKDRFKKKKKWAQCLILFVLRGNMPTAHRICHFSKWLHIKQNDFAVHHRLNSAWNVINLCRSWKQSLYLVAQTVTNCKATGS